MLCIKCAYQFTYYFNGKSKTHLQTTTQFRKTTFTLFDFLFFALKSLKHSFKVKLPLCFDLEKRDESSGLLNSNCQK